MFQIWGAATLTVYINDKYGILREAGPRIVLADVWADIFVYCTVWSGGFAAYIFSGVVYTQPAGPERAVATPSNDGCGCLLFIRGGATRSWPVAWLEVGSRRARALRRLLTV